MNQLQNKTPSAGASDDIELTDWSRLPAEPLVSVCMITYQHAAFIKEALDSVLMQKVQFPYEICLGEDGSTDGTREICVEYAKQHPDKIRLFLRDRSNPDRGVFTAPYMFNFASTFDACRGRYIALLEGDDWWLDSHKLQLQINQLEADRTLAASCHYAVAVLEGEPWAASIIPDHAIKDFSLEAILRRDVLNLHTSTWVLRRGKQMEWEPFRGSSFGDYPVWVWTLLQGAARVLPRICSAYRIHQNGVFSPLSHEIRLRKTVELWRCFESIVPPPMHSALAIGTARALIRYTRELRRGGKYGAALANFKRTIAHVANIRSSMIERVKLQLLALESLVIPRLAGLRTRWRMRHLLR